MPAVNLTDEEWRTVMAVLAKGPWDVVNSLLMKIGEQLRTQGSQLPEVPHAKQQRGANAKPSAG